MGAGLMRAARRRPMVPGAGWRRRPAPRVPPALRATDVGEKEVPKQLPGRAPGKDLDYHEADLRGLSPQQLDEHAKSRWRRHMTKPVRRVRRFLKRSGKGKGRGGKGKSRGTSRYSFLADMSDEELEHTFLGKGKGKGKSRSIGRGKGRRRNPIAADGQVMNCCICGSDVHVRAE